MKKLSEKRKIWLVKHSKILARKRRKKYFSRYRLVAPSIMSLEKTETLSFLNEVRRLADNRKQRLCIDFTKITSITPSCALVFTSEIHRSSLIRGVKNRLRVVDFNKWNHDIRRSLNDMGMFELLRISNLPKKFTKDNPVDKERFFKFVSDKKINGEKSVAFRDIVAAATSDIPNKKQLQEALGEAMDNSLFHGYPDEFMKSSPLKQMR